MRGLYIFSLSVLCLMLALSLCTSPVRAQETPVQNPPYYSQLFPKPTGHNAYEDWVMAGDILRAVKEVNDALDAPLTAKRRLLTMPAVQRVLALIREGMDKPLATPHEIVDENTTYPELAGFRNLARLLSMQIYVQLADGRTDAALETFLLGMQFGHRVQVGTIINGLVGVAIQSTVMKPIATHLDKLSQYQCMRLQRIVENIEEWRSPVLLLLGAEKSYTIRILEQKRSSAKSLVDFLELIAGSYDEDADPNSENSRHRRLIQKSMQQIEEQANALNATIDEAVQRLRVIYDHALLNATLPAKQRTKLPSAGLFDTTTPGGVLASSLTVNFNQVIEKYDRILTQTRLLGVRAAIGSFRWEYSRLPTGLAELHLGKRAIDPTTGEAFGYIRTGETYELKSADSNIK